jgi:serine protease Do
VAAPVTPDESLAFLVAQQPVGSRIPLELIRGGRRQAVTVQIAERPTEEELARLNGVETEEELAERPADQQSEGQRSARASLGITVQALTPEIARSLRLTDPTIRGVVVTSVDPNSDAAVKRLQQGDIILSVNQRPTTTPEQAAAAVDAARAAGRNAVLLQVRRGNAPPLFIGVELARR